METETSLRTSKLFNRPSIRFTSVLLVFGFVGACDPGDGTESDEQGLKEDLSIKTINRTVTVGNWVQRQVTGKWQPQPRCRTMKGPQGPRTTCLATQPGDYIEAAVHEFAGAGPADAPFPAKWGNQAYQGCGVAAAYNVLAYYGAANPFPGGIRFTKFSDSRIMSVPSRLREDLEGALNRQAAGSYSVNLFYGGPTFKIIGNALAAGNVVVALVNNGTHWQTITGMREAGSDEWGRTIWQYFATDYGFGGVWRTEGELDLELHGWDSLGSILGGGDAFEYRSDTFLIVRKNS